MSRQGYLILHDKKHGARIYFFSLEDGFLKYFQTSSCLKCIGEVRLSGCKVVVKAQKRVDGVPNSFYVETRKVFVKDRSYTLGNPVRLELSASSNDDRQEWGKALFSWQRYYWRDPRNNDLEETAHTAESVKQALEDLLDKYFPASNNAPSLAKQPLSFLRRNAVSIRRSFSLSFPSSASTASSSSSSSSRSSAKPTQSSCSAGVKDCEKERVTLSKVNGGSSSYSHPHHGATASYSMSSFFGSNQEPHVY